MSQLTCRGCARTGQWPVVGQQPPDCQDARVSIGLPVYNGALLLPRALRALTDQSHQNFELVISDNASNDETCDVCSRWAAGDPRIRYVRQPENIGPVGNFQFVLSQAKSPFFMWAAHDDWWHPDFVTENLHVLLNDPQVVGSVSEVEFVDRHDRVVPFDPGTRPLMGNVPSNLIAYLRRPAANSRFYGLFRTDVIRSCFLPTDTYWAGDWAVMARTLTHGKHHCVQRCLMRRSIKGMSSDMAGSIPRFNRTWLSRRFPMLPFTRALLSEPTIPKSWALVLTLAKIHLQYWRYSCGLADSKKFRHEYVYPIFERFGLRRARKAA